MRFSYIAAAMCTLGAIKAQVTNTTQPQQGSNSTQTGGSQGNTTIFQILNSTDGSSPAPQLAQFLRSSPNYQPIIDILNNPESNVTLFLPNDQVFAEIMGQSNSTSNGTEGGSSTAITGPTGSVTTEAGAGSTSQPTATSAQGGTASIAARYVKLPMADDEKKINNDDIVERISVGSDSNFVMRALSGIKIKMSDSTLTRRQEDGSGQNGSTTDQNSTSSQGNSTSQNSSTLSNYTTSPYATQFSVLDLIYYHIVNQSITLPNSTAQNSSNQSGTGQNGTTTQNSTSQITIYQTGPNQNSTSQNVTTYILNTLLTNSTVDRLGNGSPLVVQPGMNNTNNLTVGDGIGAADINNTMTASNGMIYVIDKVLVPPVNTTDTLSALQNATFFDMILAKSNVSGDALNNATNITIFVPNNEAIQNLNMQNLSNDTIDSLLQAHIFPGVIYTSNITNGTTGATSYAGTNVTFQQSSENGTISVNGTNVVQPNILMNNGVIHLINGVLNYTSAAASGNSTQGNATESGGASSSASSTFSSASSTFSSASSTFSSASSTFTSGNTGNTATGSQGAFPAPSNTTSSSILSANDPTLVSLFFILSSTCLFFIYCV